MITHIGNINLKDVRAVNGLSLKVGYDFAKHDKPLGKPSKQRLGGQLEEWRLSFHLHFAFCDTQTLFEQLKAVCDKGEPQQLVFDYVKYAGWVTLDSIDVTYQNIADNGRPLIIKGNLTLTEYTGDTTTPPPAPAVREPSESLSNPVPIQSAVSDDVSELLPKRQPLQHLEDALIAQHKASRLLRNIDEIKAGDISLVSDSVKIINGYFASDDWTGEPVTPLPSYDHGNPELLANAMNKKQLFFAELARQAVTRGIQ